MSRPPQPERSLAAVNPQLAAQLAPHPQRHGHRRHRVRRLRDPAVVGVPPWARVAEQGERPRPEHRLPRLRPAASHPRHLSRRL